MVEKNYSFLRIKSTTQKLQGLYAENVFFNSPDITFSHIVVRLYLQKHRQQLLSKSIDDFMLSRLNLQIWKFGQILNLKKK